MVKKTRIIPLIQSTLLILLLSIYGCSEPNKYKVDISGSEVDIKVERFEDDIFGVRSVEDYIRLNDLDSSFMLDYKRGIMGTETHDGFVSVEESAKGLIEFVTFPDMVHLYNAVDSIYPNLDFLDDELSDAFSYYHYYFPEKQIPNVYTVVTPFRSQVISSQNALGICLDMYLGEQFTPYRSPMMEFPSFIIKRFRKDYMVPNAIRGWVETEFPDDAQNHRLLDEMIYQGKVLHALDLLLPETPDSLKIGYDKGKIEWCYTNDAQIWSNLIDQEILYSTNMRQFSGVLVEAPFAKGVNVPQDAPAKIAVWAGWQIVRKYMDRHPEVSLAQLFEEKDNDKILRASGYKP
ncbi:MAG: hypothetical protein ACI9JN_001227 [Bacteroidia bacterium]|jgi:hypothetical protein